MILQYDYTELFPTTLLTSVLVLLFLLLSMIIIYWKFRIFLLSLLVFIFSIIFGVMSFGIAELPFNPYLPIFFMLFQTFLFIKITIEMYQS